MQKLTWDAEGLLESSTDGTGTTSYIYDANGNRLLRIDPLGKTLYLPQQELRYETLTEEKTTTRYYAHGDLTVAMREANGVTWLSGDNHGTAEITVHAVTQATSIRRQTP